MSKALQTLMPGEDAHAAPARWYYMMRTAGSVNTDKLTKLALGLVNPHTAFNELEMQIITMFSSETHWDSKAYRKLVVDHGISGYLGAYLPKILLPKVRNDKGVLQLTGCGNTHVSNWRFCRACIDNDTQKFGAPYFHRDHQLPGVFHCLKHREPLIDGCLACGWKMKKLELNPIPPADGKCPKCGKRLLGHNPIFTNKMERIEKASLLLAKSEYDEQRRFAVVARMKASANINGLDPLSVPGRMKLAGWFSRFWGSISPNEYYALFSGLKEYQGILTSSLLRNPHLRQIDARIAHPHPIAYLLLEDYLAQIGA